MAVLLAGVALTGSVVPTFAETLNGALVKAYYNNPSLNAQRAGTRAADENVPIATSGYLPHVAATGDVGYQYSNASGAGTTASSAVSAATGATGNTGSTGVGGATGVGGTAGSTGTTTGLGSTTSSGAAGVADTVPRGVGLQVSQTLFDGLRTTNSVRQAESNVFGSRETLRNTVQSVLQSAAQSYMDVLRDTATLELRNSNIKVLDEQLRQTNDRFKVGEVTRTDVAQAESGLAGARADYYTAQANLQNSIASFRQVVGEQPTRLEPAQPLTRGLPTSLAQAITVSQVEHPNVQAALHNVDVAELQVKIAEGALLPTVSLSGSVAQRYDVSNVAGSSAFVGFVGGAINVPIYEGSAPYATIRQAKESLGQARFQVDVVRDQVRAAVISAWGLLESSRIVVQSDQSAVNASEIALNGVREEARVGQRTTLDVLNAQQTLLNARVALVGAQRDRVVATYAVLSSIGRLSTGILSLNVKEYNPVVHFEQVKDKWVGLRTPDGR
ncbi:TolC family outer membrane protein [Hyphomicrobiales bacterium BP6-180914]|uniref:TolC family outer membrane protein n=1 Tax=Lichenifustis flavocetrariae TaxID=2949735 RepID=A0AA41YS39_9HYPH|nr:TolC family outer membrane protein [Lichenifustis flavocetrariae]